MTLSKTVASCRVLVPDSDGKKAKRSKNVTLATVYDLTREQSEVWAGAFRALNRDSLQEYVVNVTRVTTEYL